MALEESVTAPLRVLELYSGIGGMHAALERAVPGQYNVVSAFDINNIANDIYKHNFPDTKVFQGLIEGIRPDVFARRYQADVYMMSPPCQPYTRTGHQQGIDDSRSKSFVYILNAIRTLEHPPSYILLENVKGFEFSNGRNAIIDVLKERDYTWQEFLLSPDQFGIPNSRLPLPDSKRHISSIATVSITGPWCSSCSPMDICAGGALGRLSFMYS
eukprot:m.78292 g.78292  ORF g.78292 m.78292 type:complete len:215 (+) comp12531_c0_seq3:180-824(+)